MPIFRTSSPLGLSIPVLPHASGRFYSGPIEVSASTSSALTADVLYANPVLIPNTRTYTVISIESTGTGAGTCRLGIYKDHLYAAGATDGGYPDELVLDAGTVTTVGAAAHTITISQSLTPGWYWLAIVDDNTPNVRRIAASSVLGSTTNAEANWRYSGWSNTFTYGTLPANFPTGSLTAITNAPRVMIGF